MNNIRVSLTILLITFTSAPRASDYISSPEFNRESTIKINSCKNSTKCYIRLINRKKHLFEQPHLYNFYHSSLNGGITAGKKTLRGYTEWLKMKNIAVFASGGEALAGSNSIYGAGALIGMSYIEDKFNNFDNMKVIFPVESNTPRKSVAEWIVYSRHPLRNVKNSKLRTYFLSSKGNISLDKIAYFSLRMDDIDWLDDDENEAYKRFIDEFKFTKEDVDSLLKLRVKALKELPSPHPINNSQEHTLNDKKTEIEKNFEKLSDNEKIKLESSDIALENKMAVLGIDETDYEDFLKEIELGELDSTLETLNEMAYGTVSIIALFDKQTAAKLNQFFIAKNKLIQAIESIRINRSINWSSAGNLASGISIVLELTQSQNQTNIDLIILDLLQKILRNQAIILREVQQISKLLMATREDIWYLFDQLDNLKELNTRSYLELKGRLSSIEKKIESQRIATNQRFKDDTIVDIKLNSDIILQDFLDPTSPSFREQLNCLANKEDCSDSAKARQEKIASHLNTIFSYSTNKEIYQVFFNDKRNPLETASSVKWIEFSDIYPEDRNETLVHLSHWMNEQIRHLDFWEKRNLVKVDTSKYDDLINRKLLATVLIPEFVKVSQFYNEYDSLISKANLLKWQFDRTKAAKVESRLAVPLAFYLYQQHAKTVIDAMPTASQTVVQISDDYFKSKDRNRKGRKIRQKHLYEYLSRITNKDAAVLFGTLEAPESFKFLEHSNYKNSFLDKSGSGSLYKLIHLGEGLKIWNISEEIKPLPNADFQSNFNGSTVHSHINQNELLYSIELTPQGINLDKQKQLRKILNSNSTLIRKRYSVEIPDFDKDQSFKSVFIADYSKENFAWAIKDSPDGSARKYTAFVSENYVGDKDEEHFDLSEEVTWAMSQILYRALSVQIKTDLDKFKKQLKFRGDHLKEKLENYENSRLALQSHILFGYNECLEKVSFAQLNSNFRGHGNYSVFKKLLSKLDQIDTRNFSELTSYFGWIDTLRKVSDSMYIPKVTDPPGIIRRGYSNNEFYSLEDFRGLARAYSVECALATEDNSRIESILKALPKDKVSHDT